MAAPGIELRKGSSRPVAMLCGPTAPPGGFAGDFPLVKDEPTEGVQARISPGSSRKPVGSWTPHSAVGGQAKEPIYALSLGCQQSSHTPRPLPRLRVTVIPRVNIHKGLRSVLFSRNSM